MVGDVDGGCIYEETHLLYWNAGAYFNWISFVTLRRLAQRLIRLVTSRWVTMNVFVENETKPIVALGYRGDDHGLRTILSSTGSPKPGH